MGKSKKQTIGYKYHLGMHVVVAQQIDAILALKFQNKTAWTGFMKHGRIGVSKPNLFGGKKKEGGVSGAIDVLDGRASQGVNSYLRRILGDHIPAFRDITSMVFRGFYFGNNPYIKPMSIKAGAIHCHFDDWYPEKAEIGHASRINDVSLYIAMDHSNSMTSQRLATMRAAVSGLIDSLKGGRNDVRIVTFNDGIGASITRMNAKNSDYDDLKDWVNTPRSTSLGNKFSVALSKVAEFYQTVEATGGAISNIFGAPGQFASVGSAVSGVSSSSRRRVALIITDGEQYTNSDVAAANAIIDQVEGLEVYGFNIDTAGTYWTSQVDNTPGDGVPIVSGGDPDALKRALSQAFTTYVDMNPAHILRAALIAPASGGTGDVTEIGDSFTAAADLFHKEGLGLSFYWKNTESKLDFKKIVESHVDASCYQDRVTGKWEIKPIRNDYDVADLPVFGVGGIPVVSWGEVSRPDPWELPNQVTVTYTKRSNGNTGSVTIANVAALQATGRIKTEKVEYEGVTKSGLASRLCQRDLAALTTPLLSGSFTAAYLPAEINLGSAIIIHEPKLGIDPTVVRVTEFDEGDGLSNAVSVNFVEDKFATGDEDLIVEDVDGDEVPDPIGALPSDVRMIEEAPYHSLTLELGQSVVDQSLASEPDAGRLLATGNQPTGDHINALLAVDAGTGYVDGGVAEFSPVARLIGDLSRDPTDTTVSIPLDVTLEQVTAGSLAQIGREIVRVDDMQVVDEAVTLTLGRGCLDTVPAPHPVGSSIIFWQVGADIGGTDYLLGEQLDVKFLCQTGSEILPLTDADVDQVTFASRAVRPYPVGQMKVEGSYTPTDILPETASLTWAHRDRIFQTTTAVEDHTMSSIGPEAGVSYHAVVQAVEEKEDYFAATDFFAQDDFFAGDARRLISEGAVSPANGTSHSLGIVESDFFARADYFAPDDYFEGCFTDRTVSVELGIRTDRDGYENWQTPFVRASALLAPVGLSLEVI